MCSKVRRGGEEEEWLALVPVVGVDEEGWGVEAQ